MKLDLGQTFNTLANVGVIAGIIFLAVEIQQNNEMLEAQISYAQFNALRERRANAIEHAELVVKSLSETPLTQSEELTIMLLVNDVLDEHRWQFRELQAGRLPDDYIDLRIWHDVWDTTPQLRALFEEDRSRLDPAFVSFVEDNIINRP